MFNQLYFSKAFFPSFGGVALQGASRDGNWSEGFDVVDGKNTHSTGDSDMISSNDQ